MLASPSAAACTSADSILLFSFSAKEQDFKPLKDIFSQVTPFSHPLTHGIPGPQGPFVPCDPQALLLSAIVLIGMKYEL